VTFTASLRNGGTDTWLFVGSQALGKLEMDGVESMDEVSAVGD
jgi:hypothetical protein